MKPTPDRIMSVALQHRLGPNDVIQKEPTMLEFYLILDNLL